MKRSCRSRWRAGTVAVVLVLVGAPVAAQQAHPITDPDVRIYLRGCSVLPPGAQDWFITWTGSLGSEAIFPHQGDPEARKKHSMFAVVRTWIQADSLASLDSLEALLRRILAPEAGLTRVSDSLWRDTTLAPLALAYRTLVHDTRVPGQTGKPYPTLTRGVLVCHPLRPDLMIHAMFSERVGPGERPEADAVAERFASGLRLTVRDTSRTRFLPLRYDPDAIAFGHGSFWVSTWDYSLAPPACSVYRVDSTLSKVEARIPVPHGIMELVVTDDAVWVPGSLGKKEGRLSRIDPARNQVTATVELGKHVQSACAGAGALWVMSEGDRHLWKLDARNGATLAKLKLSGKRYGDVLALENTIWVADRTASDIVGINPASCRVEGPRIGTGSDPIHLVAGAGSLWALCLGFGGVQRFSAKSRAIQATVPIEQESWLSGFAFDGSSVWTGDFLRGTLHRIDPATNQVTPLPYTPACSIARILAHGDFLVIVDRLENGLVRVAP